MLHISCAAAVPHIKGMDAAAPYHAGLDVAAPTSLWGIRRGAIPHLLRLDASAHSMAYT
jgi:hypothetical protein